MLSGAISLLNIKFNKFPHKELDLLIYIFCGRLKLKF